MKNLSCAMNTSRVIQEMRTNSQLKPTQKNMSFIFAIIGTGRRPKWNIVDERTGGLHRKRSYRGIKSGKGAVRVGYDIAERWGVDVPLVGM